MVKIDNYKASDAINHRTENPPHSTRTPLKIYNVNSTFGIQFLGWFMPDDLLTIKIFSKAIRNFTNVDLPTHNAVNGHTIITKMSFINIYDCSLTSVIFQLSKASINIYDCLLPS